MSGEAPYTGQFMGSIHPRVKKIVGTRLAKAARALVYGDKNTVWTGPVLQSCVVAGNTIQLSFDQAKLGADTIMVLNQVTNAIPLVMADDQGAQKWDMSMLALIAKLGPESPMEIQISNHSNQVYGGNMTDGVWLPVSVLAKCTPAGVDVPTGNSGACSWNRTTGTKEAGWDQVDVSVDGLGKLVGNITGIRYA